MHPVDPNSRFPAHFPGTTLPIGRVINLLASLWPKAQVSLSPIGRSCLREDSSSLCRCLAQQQGFCRVGGGGEHRRKAGLKGVKGGVKQTRGSAWLKKRKGSHPGRNSPHVAVGNRVRKGAGATRVTSSRSCQ